MPSLLDIFRKIKVSPDDALDLDLDDFGPTPERTREAEPAKLAPPEPDPEVAKLREDLARERRERKEDRDREQVGRIKDGAKAFAKGLVDAKKLMPAGTSAMETIHAFAHLHAAGLPVDGLDLGAALAKLPEGLVAHSLRGEAVKADGRLPEGLKAMAGAREGYDPQAAAKAQNEEHLGPRG